MLTAPDRPNSTYWWKMNLDNSHPENKVQYLIGYSKWQNQAEAINKIDCLIAKVEMLHRKGYVERSNSIEIYQRVGLLPSEATDLKILILYKKDFEINPRLVGNVDYRLKEFLKKIYILVNEKKPVENLIPKKDISQLKTKDSLYDLRRQVHKSIHACYEWCEKMIASGENRERVMSYYINYTLKYFSTNQ